MPKRVIDFDALWASDKLAECAEWAQAEYAWLYGLADASGSFELTNLRVVWGRVAAIRKNLTLERLQEIFDEFIARGLLFAWQENGKRYGHWTGSDLPGRLPAPSWRARLEKLAPPVPPEGLAAYSARFGGSKEGIVRRACAGSAAPGPQQPGSQGGPAEDLGSEASAIKPIVAGTQGGLKHGLEEAQAQGLDLNLDLDLDSEERVCPGNLCNEVSKRAASQPDDQPAESGGHPVAEELLDIYEQERGALPRAGAMTRERRRQCERLLASGFTPAEFRAAARCAAATPFLTGAGDRGWQASFDWLIANSGNARKVLAGEYASSARERGRRARGEKRAPADLYVGIAPRPADCGVRVNPAALERIRARQAHADAGKTGPPAGSGEAQARAAPAG